jgi:hypothetical protein
MKEKKAKKEKIEKKEEIISRINKSLKKIKNEINRMDTKGKKVNLQLKIGLPNPSNVQIASPIKKFKVTL